MLREINRQYAATFSGDSFCFRDITACIFYQDYARFCVMVYHSEGCRFFYERFLKNDYRIASFSFDHLDDAVYMMDYTLCKIILADALFGWECLNR